MALSQAVLSTLLGRGYSQSHLDDWVKNHPGDEGRALSAFGVQGSGGSNGNNPGASGNSAAGSNSNSQAAMSALGKVADPGISNSAQGQTSTSLMGGGGGAAGGVGFVAGVPGQLRGYLGMRQPSNEQSALAALRRLY